MTGREIVYCARKHQRRLDRVDAAVAAVSGAISRGDWDAALSAVGEAYDRIRNEVRGRNRPDHDPNEWLHTYLGDAS